MLLILVKDFCWGLWDVFAGLSFIIKLHEEESKEIKVEPEAPRERTVLEMRREKQGIYRRPPEPPKKKDSVFKKIFQIYVMNLLFLVAWKLFVFLFGFLSYLTLEDDSYGRIIGNCLIFPIFTLSRILQSLWFSDVSGACMRALNQKPPVKPLGFSYVIAETLIAAIHSTFFLIQGILSQYLPIPLITPFIVYLHMALLNSMYSFDYFFDNYNLPFLRRRDLYESHWPYFLGFGTPLAIPALFIDDLFFNAAIFALFFPFMIISSYKANFNRRYEEKIPAISFCRISYMLTQLVGKFVKYMTPTFQPVPQKAK